MWNGHHSSDGIVRRHGRSSRIENEIVLSPVDSHGVASLSAFQPGSSPATYNTYIQPQYGIPPGYPPSSSEMDYHHHHQRGTHPVYNAGQHHMYYHGHHQLSYPPHTDEQGSLLYQQSRHSQEALDDHFNEDAVRQPATSEAGTLDYRQSHSVASEEKQHLSDEDSSEEDISNDNKANGTSKAAPVTVPRGKPQAMTEALATTRRGTGLRELKSQQGPEPLSKNSATYSDEDIVPTPSKTGLRENSRRIREADKSKLSNPSDYTTSQTSKNVDSKVHVSAKAKAQVKSKVPTKPPTPIKNEQPDTNIKNCELLLNQDAPVLTDLEYKSLEALFIQFCRVPLLAEFSRPVALLHPELGASYSKIVKHPVDVGRICRGVRRRQYKNSRDIRLDMWRVFANCVKFHSHPNNKEAAPSFVSIALHLRDFFNHLWQEFMISSDYKTPSSKDLSKDAFRIVKEVRRNAFNKREEERAKRLQNSGVLVLSKPYTKKRAELLRSFIDNGGCVDWLDIEPVFKSNDDPDLRILLKNLKSFQHRLNEISDNADVDYTLDNFYHDLRDCYAEDGVLNDNSILRSRVRNRIERFFWKQAVPLHEANSRGVTQSSIWGNIAATIWARESSKKPYWPALCLGILPPAEQREGWHVAVTERNESRLPEKLRTQLMTAKARCEAAQNRQSLSYFLVEFLGTHEFIWVRETDIVENFDPKDDPNKNAKASSKKSRSLRTSASSVIGSKAYQTALEECTWAYDEYESVLQDAFEYQSDSEVEESDEVINYSFSVLAQSDDEADAFDGRSYEYDEDDMSVSDVDEANWLITHDGLLDNTATGRKNAKLRTMALKKEAASKDKKDETLKKKVKGKDEKNESREKDNRDSKSSKDRKERNDEQELLGIDKGKDQDEKSVSIEQDKSRELREREKKRRKRIRDRERAIRNEDTKEKSHITGSNQTADDIGRGLQRDKRARASAIVNAYVARLAIEEGSKSFARSGVMTMPSAMVESTGILGMALAFRSAAGEISMPDDGDEQNAKTHPWSTIDTLSQKLSSERCESLERQIELLENEISRVRSETLERIKLADDLFPKQALKFRQIQAYDTAARQNHYKQRKKPVPRLSTSSAENLKHKIARRTIITESKEHYSILDDRSQLSHDSDDTTD